MDEIKWQQEREVSDHVETGETYVRVRGGFMLAEDYARSGGRVERFEAFELGDHRLMTNAQLQEQFG